MLDLVARHCQRLAAAGVDGHMLGWSLGGYPSPNLDVARRFAADPAATADAVLDAVAADRYGPAGAADARRAWAAFSAAFEQYPYAGNVVYRCPVQLGPANLLYATADGVPVDDGRIPVRRRGRVVGPVPRRRCWPSQFEAVAAGWETGLEPLARAAAAAPADPPGRRRGRRAVGAGGRDSTSGPSRTRRASSTARDARAAAAADPAAADGAAAGTGCGWRPTRTGSRGELLPLCAGRRPGRVRGVEPLLLRPAGPGREGW